MAGQDPVVSIDRPYDSGSRYSEGPKFIWCVDGLEPQIHEVWDFSEDVVSRKVFPTAQVDVGTGVVREFLNDSLTENWRRFLMFGRISVN